MEVPMAPTVYEENGYRNRIDYLTSLAEEYDFPLESVLCLADVLGPEEDFDALVTMVQDESGRS
jgi:hypothetical protein